MGAASFSTVCVCVLNTIVWVDRATMLLLLVSAAAAAAAAVVASGCRRRTDLAIIYTYREPDLHQTKAQTILLQLYTRMYI